MNNDTLYCGVDVHSKKSYFCFLNTTGEVIKHQEIITAATSINALLKDFPSCQINYAFEAGNMTRYFYRIIKSVSTTNKIHIVHPFKFKIITSSTRKNDKEDSKKLAYGLLKDNLPLPVHLKSEHCKQLQLCLNIRRRIVNTKTKIALQAKSICRSNGMNELKKWSSAASIRKAIDLLKEVAFEKELLEDLHKEYTEEAKKIKEIEKKISGIIFEDEKLRMYYELLLSIPGIGPITSAKCSAEIDDIDRFERAGQLSAYFGLIPSEHSSGEKIIHGRITKEGVKEVRALLIQAAWTIVRLKTNTDERLKSLQKKFYRISFKGKHSQKAITAIARQLTRIIFGVLKHKKPYCGEITSKQEAKSLLGNNSSME